MALWIKICGVTSPEQARLAVAAGADAVGVNLVPSSKRRVDDDTARAVVRAVGDDAEVVAVVADLDVAELRALAARTGVHSLQLHGGESPAVVAELAPLAYQAVRIATAADVTAARAFSGARLLADAKVAGELGGTGHAFDWALVTELARERPLVVAGGLTPENVGRAVQAVRPYGVDTASGVEGPNPRVKDPDKVRRFIETARRAAAAVGLDTTPGVDYQPKGNP